MKDVVKYGLAVGLYIALGLVTKRFLTWTWGPFYFIVVLEVLPRTFNRLRHGPGAPKPLSESFTSADAIPEL